MDFLRNNLLTLLIVLPSAGAVLTLFQRDRVNARRAALGTTVVTLAASLLLLAAFDWRRGAGYAYAADGGTVQLVQDALWIPAFNIHYKVGIDGLSFPLVMLTTVVCVLACVASWDVTRMTRGYFALFLALESAVMGTFLSLDLFLFYVFFEVSLLPMYFLIGIWGGPRREYAAIKFFLYTLVGSIGLLVALIGVYLHTRGLVPATAGHGAGTFDLVALAAPSLNAALAASMGGAAGAAAKGFFLLLMFGFLVKLPSVPFHTWLPDAHVEAPTPMSMVLAALLLKLGGYGVFRVAYPLFPGAARHLWLVVAVFGVVSILYGALCAMAQTDFKRLVAYSSVSHMGFVTLGAAMMTEASVHGAIFMMVAHGVISAMMFFVVGVIHDRARHRDLSRYGGIATTLPVYTGFGTLACFANLGLPGLCGFVGEVMVLLGTFAAARPDSVLRSAGLASRGAILTLGVLACLGMVLTAGYMLWTIQRVFFGPERAEHRGFPDVDRREVAVLVPLAILAVALGVLPTFFVFGFTQQSVTALLALFS